MKLLGVFSWAGLLVCSLLCSLAAMAEDLKKPIDCHGQKGEKELSCLQSQFNLCANDPGTCYKILDRAKAKARSCKRVKDTAHFFETTKYLDVDVAADDYMSEAIESLFLANPECLLDATLTLDSLARRAIIHRVENPYRLIKGQKEVLRRVEKYKKHPKYKKLFDGQPT